MNANICARRKQLWVGELEDPDFKRFCAKNRIPLVTFDWPLIAQLTELGGDGRGSTAGALAMWRGGPPVAYRVVEDQDRDYFAREVYTLLSKLRQRGGDSREPAVVKTAYKLCGLPAGFPAPRGLRRGDWRRLRGDHREDVEERGQRALLRVHRLEVEGRLQPLLGPHPVLAAKAHPTAGGRGHVQQVRGARRASRPGPGRRRVRSHHCQTTPSATP